MKTIKWLTLIFLMLLSVPAIAEFYKFIDKNGNVHYTDDLSRVPENQRSSVSEYKEYKSDTDNEQVELQKGDIKQPFPEKKKEINNSLDKTGKLLEIKKQKLDKEYQDLMKEKEEIEKEKKNIKTEIETRKRNEKVLALNEKIKNYEKKIKTFNAEVEAYNAKAAEDLKQKTEQYEAIKKGQSE